MFGRKGFHLGKSIDQMVNEALTSPLYEDGPAPAGRVPSTLGVELLRFGGELVVVESSFWESKPAEPIVESDDML